MENEQDKKQQDNTAKVSSSSLPKLGESSFLVWAVKTGQPDLVKAILNSDRFTPEVLEEQKKPSM